MEDGEPESRQLRPRYAVSRSCFRISSRNANAPPTTVSGLQSRKLSKVRAARASSGALSQRASPKKPTDGYVQVLENPPEERIKDGFLDVPDEPGLGVRLSAERVRGFLWARCTT